MPVRGLQSHNLNGSKELNKSSQSGKNMSLSLPIVKEQRPRLPRESLHFDEFYVQHFDQI